MLPMQIREIEFVFHQTDISGLIICSILTTENVKIIDREIIKNLRSYQLYKHNDIFVIQPAGNHSFQLNFIQVVHRNTVVRQDPVFGFL